MDLDETTLHEKIKRIARQRGMTLTALGNEYNRRYGTKYRQQGFSLKLIRGAVRYDELKKIGDILGFKVEIVLDEET